MDKLINADDLNAAIDLIVAGKATRLELRKGVTIYKVPSNKPDKYVIRMDLKYEVQYG